MGQRPPNVSRLPGIAALAWARRVCSTRAKRWLARVPLGALLLLVLGIVLTTAAVALGWLHAQVETELVARAQQRHRLAAQAIANTASPALHDRSTETQASASAKDTAPNFAEVLRSTTRGLGLDGLRLFDQRGRLLYSSNPRDQAGLRLAQPELAALAGGAVLSRLGQGSTPGEPERWVVNTQVATGAPPLIVELRSDVAAERAALLAQRDQRSSRVALLAAALLLALALAYHRLRLEALHETMRAALLERRVEDLDLQLDELATQMPVMMVEIDRKLNYRWGNAVAADWIGVAPDRMAGLAASEAPGPIGAAALRSLCEQAFEGATAQQVLALAPAANEERWLKVWARPREQDGRQVGSALVYAIDITHERLQARALRSARAQLVQPPSARWLAHWSQHLRAPAGVIAGAADLMAQDDAAPLPPVQRERLGTIRDSAARLLTLLDPPSAANTPDLAAAAQPTDVLCVVGSAAGADTMHAAAARRPQLKVATVASAHDAIAWACGHAPPALALIDLQLPDQPGTKLLNTLRALDDWDEVRCVALAAGPLSDRLAELERSGFNGLAAPPRDVDELLACLDSWLEARD